MVQVHAVIGLILIIIAVALTIWNALRLGTGIKGPSFRMVLVGLLDLQVLLGIIALIVWHHFGRWLLHPVLMLIAVAFAHTMLKDSKAKSTQILGYVLVLAFLLLGLWLPNAI